jgi:hypothetical protein
MACDEYVEEMELRSVTKILKKLAEKPAPLLIYVRYEVILDKSGDQAICHFKV